MARSYTAPLVDIALGTDTDQDIWQLVAGANNKLRLTYFELTTSAVAAAAISLRLLRRTTTGTGAAAVESPLDKDDEVATATLSTIVEAPGTAGIVFFGKQWEQLGSLVWQPTPNREIVVKAGGRIALNSQTSFASVTGSGVVEWEEI